MYHDLLQDMAVVSDSEIDQLNAAYQHEASEPEAAVDAVKEETLAEDNKVIEELTDTPAAEVEPEPETVKVASPAPAPTPEPAPPSPEPETEKSYGSGFGESYGDDSTRYGGGDYGSSFGDSGGDCGGFDD